MTQTEAKWTERVKTWRSSGQTAKAFAQGREFKASTLTYWAYRLRQAGQQSSARVEGSATGSAATGEVRMVRVLRTSEGSATGAPSSATMVIAIGAARIEVRSGFDRGLLTEVVEALGGAR